MENAFVEKAKPLRSTSFGVQAVQFQWCIIMVPILWVSLGSFPSLPVIPPQVRCLIGMFLGSKYLQTQGVWKPRVWYLVGSPYLINIPKIGIKELKFLAF